MSGDSHALSFHGEPMTVVVAWQQHYCCCCWHVSMAMVSVHLQLRSTGKPAMGMGMSADTQGYYTHALALMGGLSRLTVRTALNLVSYLVSALGI